MSEVYQPVPGIQVRSYYRGGIEIEKKNIARGLKGSNR